MYQPIDHQPALKSVQVTRHYISMNFYYYCTFTWGAIVRAMVCRHKFKMIWMWSCARACVVRDCWFVLAPQHTSKTDCWVHTVCTHCTGYVCLRKVGSRWFLSYIMPEPCLVYAAVDLSSLVNNIFDVSKMKHKKNWNKKIQIWVEINWFEITLTPALTFRSPKICDFIYLKVQKNTLISNIHVSVYDRLFQPVYVILYGPNFFVEPFFIFFILEKKYIFH